MITNKNRLIIVKTFITITIVVIVLDSLLHFLWFNSEKLSLLDFFFLINKPKEIFSKLFIIFTVLVSGGVIFQIGNRHKLFGNQQLKTERNHLITLNSIGYAIISIDAERIIKHINPAAEDLVGMSLEKAVGKKIDSILELLNSSTLKKIYNKSEIFSVSKVIKDLEFAIIVKNDEIKFVSLSSSYLRDKDNQIEEIILIFRNITKERTSLIDIKKSEDTLNQYIQCSPIGIIVYDENGEYVHINKLAKSLSRTSIQRIDASVKDRIRKGAWKNSKVNNNEYDLEYQNGCPCSAYVNFCKILANRIIVSVTDITNTKEYEREISQNYKKLKKIEHELIEKKKFLSSLISNIPGIVFRFSCDREVKLDYLSDNFKEITGYDAEEFMSGRMKKIDIIHPDDAHLIDEKLKIAENNNNFYSIEFRINDINGNTIWINEKANTVLGTNGEIEHIYGVMLDVTNEKEAQLELVKNQAKIEMIFESMSDILVLHEMIYNESKEPIDYRIDDVNSAFTNCYGIPKDKVIGKLASEFYQTDFAPNLKDYSKVVKTGEIFSQEVFNDQVNKYFLTFCVKYMEDHFATIATDISDIKQAEKILRYKNKELEDYLFVVSHDLRTPLVNIQGFSQRLHKQIKQFGDLSQSEVHDRNRIEIMLNEEIPNSLEYICTNVKKMDYLINGLIKISRTGSIGMTVTRIDMNEIISNVLSVMNFQIDDLDIKIPRSNLLSCYGDKDLLEQLFMNLISNSIKYREKSRQLIIDIYCEVSPNSIDYYIKDNGIGISEKNQKKIWNVFYRVDPNSEVKGEGIGLSLVKKIIDRHLGYISIKSEVNIGTTFKVELPKYKF